MSRTTPFLAAALGLALFAGAMAQQRPDDDKRGYDERVAVRGQTTIRTREGRKSVGVTVSKIAVTGGKVVTLELPEKGFAIFQHRAAEVEIRINNTRRELREGEWITVPLPAKVVIATEDDTALLDAIIVTE